MGVERWVRNEKVLGTIWFLGEEGFGPGETIPTDVSKVNFLWSAADAPFLSSQVYSTQSILLLNPKFPDFVETLSVLLNQSHRDSRQGAPNKQPAFWTYPFVKPADYAWSAAIESTYKIDKDVNQLIRETEIGRLFHRAILQTRMYTVFPLFCRARTGSMNDRKFVLFNEDVWSSELELTSEQWKSAIRMMNEQKKGEIGSFLQQLDGGQAPVVRLRITEAVRSEVWRRDMGRCVQCTANERLEFDHIIPLSRGGSDTARNLQLLCETCNRQKGASI